jgi:hypothetical protein
MIELTMLRKAEVGERVEQEEIKPGAPEDVEDIMYGNKCRSIKQCR